MKRIAFSIVCAFVVWGGASAEQPRQPITAQPFTPDNVPTEWTLQALIDTAMAKSALLSDYAYKIEGQAVEQEWLRAVYMRSQVEVTGEWLFVPVVACADTIDSLLVQQTAVLERMAESGLAKQSDVRLLRIEQQANNDMRLAAEQDYTQHLADLRAICGLRADEPVVLPAQDADIALTATADRSLFAETYRLDSLRMEAERQALRAPYLPQLDVFVNGGLQTGDYDRMYRHFGWAAGLTFRWKIYDGRQQQLRTRQIRLRQDANATYRSSAERQRRIRLQQCLDTWRQYDKRLQTAARQLAEYDAVMQDYAREMQAGQLSVLDYLTLLRRRVQVRQDYLLLLANRNLAAVAYNY